LDVVQGDGESLPFPDASFDFVVLMEVLVHVHDPRKMLAEIKRVFKPGGVLLGSCPHKNMEMNIWDDARLHHAYYTTAEAYDLLRETFEKVYLKVLNGAQFAAEIRDQRDGATRRRDSVPLRRGRHQTLGLAAATQRHLARVDGPDAIPRRGLLPHDRVCRQDEQAGPHRHPFQRL
jgi:SAM-dependent methyltransferase